ncbi:MULTISPECIES: cytochrome c biogenesis protein CcsA [unclassified Flavobacterium]|uniref:cytochrome c biogenesis protein CcsA n=1 Tax=unclassified Flavobacterium TaxID=196869 RepID=UPI001F137BCD|nr:MULTISPECIES: cytochrome c biogenesis protein CcsA [unclassified Flavobacterium]UMY65160.1 cytochrome c biogenesis protein CcsA [Flavobacterium sp. HJ-32-4]
MKKKLLSVLFSTRLMAVLFLLYAVAMAVGTYIESEYNTDTARIWIYNALWFELIMALFMVNFIGNIKRYQLHKKKNWATLLLHLAFIFILVGAAVTRYISYEGMMSIREGESSNQVLSERAYLTVLTDGQYKGQTMRRKTEKSLLLSPAVYPPFASNDFTINDQFDKIPYKVTFVDYIMAAKETVVPDPNGVEYLKIVETENGRRHEHFLKEGETQNLHNLLFSLNRFVPGAININTKGEQYTINSPFEGGFMRMADQMKGRVAKDTTQPLMMRSLYTIGNALFVFPEAAMKGKITYVSSGNYKDKQADDALIVKVANEGQERLVTLVGSKGKIGVPVSFKQGNLEYTLQFGSKVYETPFRVVLKDFIAQKYPGTQNSYSSFESKVRVEDGATKFDYHIYMNHVLDYGGYRFFQANFDPDEKGTVLSANHDFWGTWITYVGYFLLFFAMMAILFDRNTRFADLKRRLESVRVKKEKLIMGLLLFVSFSGFSQEQHRHTNINTRQIADTIAKYKVNEKTAALFGRLVLQDGGRMKPINTFSSELFRKVYKSDSFNGMNADQAFLSMTQFPALWLDMPIISLKKDNDSIRSILGIGKEEKYAPFRAFFDDRGNYKLSPFLDEAYRNQRPDQYQKDLIDADKKVVLLNSALSGTILRIFPVPGDKNNKWVSFVESATPSGTSLDTMRILYPKLMQDLYLGARKKDFSDANTTLGNIEKVQKRVGAAVRPADAKIDAEILYNKYDVFRNLFWLYMTVGSIMLILVIVNILATSKWLARVANILHITIGVLFALHTAGLVFRWYVSGHAPWSDAYESMIYVAWATMFFTLAFDRKSKLTVASGTFVASMILMIAHWNWLDPNIANLQPVLNSYWLMIHVAVIVASYGPFTLGMILGIVTMILMILVNDRNKEKMELHIREITYINEMALTIGLVMLTIGNFLGGQWANESWGRYWGWDPKETWALISIMVYAFIIHARLVPGLRGRWTFAFLSILGYYSIMMTYFGVNFYLTGLHSYASSEGKAVTTATFFYSIPCVTLLVLPAWWKAKKYLKK